MAVVGALVGTVVLVRASDHRKDELRQAQISLSAVPGALRSTVSSPLSLLAGGPIEAAEFPLNKRLRDELRTAVAGVNRHWDAPLALRLRADSTRISNRTRAVMGLLAQHRVAAANGLYKRDVEPMVPTVESDVAAAQEALDDSTRAAGRTAWTATLVITGVVGGLLVLLLVGVAKARRRRLAVEIEHGALLESERRMRVLVEHGSDMITVVRPDSTVIYQAGAVEQTLGYRPQEIEGTKLTEWIDPEDRASLLALCATVDSASKELRLRHRDGSRRTCEVHAANLLDDPGWNGLVLNIWDLSERKGLEERLRHQALHDSLTELPNRVLAIDRAEQMLARARRNSQPMAALYVDLDGFKHINDKFGHATGDELLRLVAGRLASLVRKGDTAARLAGDEFVVLLENATLDADPKLVAERLLSMLRRPYDLKAEIGKELTVTASVGISLGWGGTAEELLKDADIALYEAKRMGGNGYSLFERSMGTAAEDQLALEMDLPDALAREELFLLYQPTFDLQTESVIGVEALIRWRHPTRGIIEPNQFIPIAERNELIVPIGRWVLNEACRQAAAWQAKGNAIGMSVNVSGVQLNRDGLIDDVRNALAESGLDPTTLTLEITETVLMRDAEASAKRLTALKDLGIRIAIDDFGTGYSSLAYLHQFPVDALKIDRSFIGGIASSEESTTLIHTLVQLGKTLSIETLAEGIEETSQLKALQREECDQGQGFLFARPLTAVAVEEFMDPAKRQSRLAPRTS
ncbi:MAG: EAL domain-containing protein [Solirubrobacterales bacterium]